MCDTINLIIFFLATIIDVTKDIDFAISWVRRITWNFEVPIFMLGMTMPYHWGNSVRQTKFHVLPDCSIFSLWQRGYWGYFQNKILTKSFRPTKFNHMYIILLMWRVNKSPIFLTWEIFPKYTVFSSEHNWVSDLQPKNVMVIKQWQYFCVSARKNNWKKIIL